MSFRAIQRVYKAAPKMTAGERSVLLALAYHEHSETGEIFPSVKTLSEETCLSERSVQRALRGLEKKICLQTMPGGHGPNTPSHYRIMPGKGDNVTPLRVTNAT